VDIAHASVSRYRAAHMAANPFPIRVETNCVATRRFSVHLIAKKSNENMESIMIVGPDRHSATICAECGFHNKYQPSLAGHKTSESVAITIIGGGLLAKIVTIDSYRLIGKSHILLLQGPVVS